VLWWDNISEVHRLHPEDGGSKILRNVVSYHNTGRRYNPEDFDLNRHRRESLKTRKKLKFHCYYA